MDAVEESKRVNAPLVSGCLSRFRLLGMLHSMVGKPGRRLVPLIGREVRSVVEER